MLININVYIFVYKGTWIDEWGWDAGGAQEDGGANTGNGAYRENEEVEAGLLQG